MEAGVTIVFLSSRWIAEWRNVPHPLWATGTPYVVSTQLAGKYVVNCVYGILSCATFAWVCSKLSKRILLQKVREMLICLI